MVQPFVNPNNCAIFFEHYQRQKIIKWKPSPAFAVNKMQKINISMGVTEQINGGFMGVGGLF